MTRNNITVVRKKQGYTCIQCRLLTIIKAAFLNELYIMVHFGLQCVSLSTHVCPKQFFNFEFFRYKYSYIH